MELIMLGTGHATVTECYNTCFALKEGNEVFLVDAGGGNTILKQLKTAEIPLREIKNIFVTHKHIDHLLGVIWVIRVIGQKMNADPDMQDVTIYGNEEVIKILEWMSDMLLLPKVYKWVGKKIKFKTIFDKSKAEILGRKVTFFDIHSTKDKQHAFSMELKDGSKFTCLGDEPFNEFEKEYLDNCKWLMHEAFCLHKEADIYEPYEKHHSTAKLAGKLAKEYGVKNLLIYHTEDDNILRRKELYTEEAREEFDGNIYVPDDLDRLDIE